MAILKRLGLALVLFVPNFICLLLAQTTSSPPTGTPNRGAFRPQSCWEQAGIAQSVMPQLRQIHQSMHSQVESVCSNSSLTPQQKRHEIQQLRQQADQQMEALVSSQQLQALRSCQNQRSQAGTNMSHGGNPCGNMSANTGQQLAPHNP